MDGIDRCGRQRQLAAFPPTAIARRWLRVDPIQHKEFAESEAKRKRYWARSMVGWVGVGAARPNATHYALAELERAGKIDLLITQNVDRLHQKAGSQRVVDLHGRLDQVICLNCEAQESRKNFKLDFLKANPLLPITNTLQDLMAMPMCPIPTWKNNHSPVQALRRRRYA